MRNLWPPINVIESNLSGQAGEPLHFPDKALANDSQESANSEMPVFLRDKIRQRVSSRKAHFDNVPKAGQIWRFDGTGEQTSPMSVLLDVPQVNGRWQGWLAAPETDYATHQDVLLEPADEPFDPVASMIQTWNSVVVDVSQGSRVLAEISPERLDAIREVAKGQYAEGGGARAGFVAPVKTNAGKTVLIGTRISHPEDPRRKYQVLYRDGALKLERQHAPQTSNVVPMPSRRRIWRNVGLSLAASIILAQTAIISNLMRERPVTGAKENVGDTSEFRSVPQADQSYAYLEVNFKPDAKQVDISKLLTKLNAVIVDGPGEFGQYRVKVKATAGQDVAREMRESGVADSVEMVK